MKYVKSCLIITMLLGAGYSQCNEFNWQEYYPDMMGCQLSGADLAGTFLAYTNLTGADLTGANLYQAYLKEANLTGADLTGANLYGANLVFADLSDANFSDTFCYGAFFVLATLEGTIFDGADLTFAFFDENGDFYDDASYDAGAESVDVGDMNGDGSNNVRDVVMLVEDILNP